MTEAILDQPASQLPCQGQPGLAQDAKTTQLTRQQEEESLLILSPAEEGLVAQS